MNTIREDIEAYLSLRRSLGYKLIDNERELNLFADFLEQRNAPYITRKLAIEWVQQPHDVSSNHCRKRLSIVRGFTRFRQLIDRRTEIPESGAFAPAQHRLVPHIFTQSQVDALMHSALQMPHRFKDGAILPLTYHYLIGLMSVTGIRTGEACRLRLQDVDLEAALLTVHSSKNGRSRIVPLHETTCSALATYIRQRNAHWRNRSVSDCLFVNSKGNRVTSSALSLAFHRFARQIGLYGPNDRHKPRLYDLRHRFAVVVLQKWHENDADTERLLPVLSTYLGHVSITDTYWYLQLSPDLMSAAMRRMNSIWEGQS